MFAIVRTLPLALPFLFGAVSALNITNQDSIKSEAQTLAGQIIKTYHAIPSSSSIGLFGGVYWWVSGAVWSSMVRYSALTGDSQFDDVIAKALWAQTGETLNFMSSDQAGFGYGGQSAWAIAAMTAAETGFKKPEDGEWVDLVKNVFDDQVAVWDETVCGGGLGKETDSIATGAFFLLSARLAQFTGNAKYSEWADKSFKWLQDVKLLRENYVVYDSVYADDSKCELSGGTQWSYPFGLLTEGAAVMYNLTDGKETWKSAVQGFTDHLEIFLINSTIIHEPACDNDGRCNLGQHAYKGLLARSIGRAAVAAPFVADTFNKVLEISAKVAMANCAEVGETWICAAQWYPAGPKSNLSPIGTGNDTGDLFSMLEAVQGLLDETASTNATMPSGTAHSTASGKMDVTWGSLILTFLFTLFA